MPGNTKPRFPDPSFSLVFALCGCIYSILCALFLRHHDIGWHLAAGDVIRKTGHIPAHDSWSFTAGDFQWYNLSWLWDVLASMLYQHGGFALLISVTILLGAMIIALASQLSYQAGAGRIASLLAALFAALALAIYQQPTDFALSIAPQAMSLLFFMLLWTGLERVRSRRWRVRRLLFAPLLMLLWVNMHGGYLLYFVLIGVYTTEAAYKKEYILSRAFLLAGLAGACTMLMNPYGIDIVAGAWRSLNGVGRSSITEWKPYAFGKEFISSLYVVGFVLLALRTSIPLRFKMLAFLFFFLGLYQVRHFAYFILAALPIMARGISSLFHSTEARFAQGCASSRARIATFIIAMMGVCILANPSTIRAHFGGEPELPADIYPKEEIAYLKEHFPDARIYNHWNFGGYLIFAARDSLKILIDGRGDTAYPQAFIARYVRIGNEEDLINAYGLRLALMPRYLPQTLIYFEQSPRWKRILEGPVANIYQRVD